MTDYTKPVLCHGCKEAVMDGAYMQVGDEWWHTVCYRRAHPPKPFISFIELVRCAEDKVVFADLLVLMVPDSVQRQILESYNREQAVKHARSIS